MSPEPSQTDVEPQYQSGMERGIVQPFDDVINEMISFIDEYAVDEPSTKSRRKMLKDSQVKMVVETLKEVVLSSGWELNYDWDDEREAGQEMVDFLYTVFDRVNETPQSAGGLDDLLEKLMDALWFKKMVCELVFAHDKTQEMIYIKKAKVLPPESIRFVKDRYGNLEAVEQYPYNIEMESLTGGGMINQMPTSPVQLDLNSMLLWVNGDDYSRYEGRSELDCIYKYWFLKDFILKFWSVFTERFGAPLLVAFVKAKSMNAARGALKEIITKTSFSMEREDKLELIEPKGSGESFKNFIDYADAQITKGLLVPTLIADSSESDAGSALSELHFKMLEYRVQYIQRKLANLARALIKKILDLNFSGVKHYPVFIWKPLSTTHRVKMAQAFDLLIKNAIIHPQEKWVRAELQLPEIAPALVPEMNEAWKAQMTKGSAAPMGFGSPTAAITRPEAQTNQRTPAQIGEGFKLSSDRLAELKSQLDRADSIFRMALKSELGKVVKSLEEKVFGRLGVKSEELKMADPVWLKDLRLPSNYISEIFADTYDDVLLNVVSEDNASLMKVGMKSAWDTPTRQGKMKWLDQKMGSLKSTLKTTSNKFATELEMSILQDTKDIVSEALDEGLRGRDVADRLREKLAVKYSDARLENIVRTNTTAIVNSGKKEFAKANSDFVKGMRFVAVLDTRTTDICESLDGKEFALNDPTLDTYTPPLHYECRSVLEYITEGQPEFDPEGAKAPQEGFGEGAEGGEE